MSSVQPPDGLTCTSLKTAKSAEMAFWIGQANTAAGKRVMTKNGRVEDQRKRLADYYGLDLSAASTVTSNSAAPKTHEEDIKERQFSWLRELGEEWSSAAADGSEFLLCEGTSELCSASLLREAVELLAKLTMHTTRRPVAAPLALGGRTQAENNETISALIGAARAGDSTAISRLSNLGEVAAQLAAAQTRAPEGATTPASASRGLMASLSLTTPLIQPDASPLPTACGLQVLLPILQSTTGSALRAGAQPAVSLPLVLQSDGSMPAATVSADHSAMVRVSSGLSLALASSESSPAVLPGPCMNDMAVLSSCQIDIESIQRAQGLRDAIEQVEDGAVGRVRKRYGPKDGRAADEMWGRLKGKITKRERLYALLTGAFKGDKDSFFEYFTISTDSKPTARTKRHLHRQGDRHGSESKLVALRLVVEAIPHCQKDLQDERKNARYVDQVTGQFSGELWRAAWGCQNDWYVWRALGKERYGR